MNLLLKWYHNNYYRFYGCERRMNNSFFYFILFSFHNIVNCRQEPITFVLIVVVKLRQLKRYCSQQFIDPCLLK